MTFTIFLVLITIVSFLLVVVIMVQNPKGGGLSSSIGGPQIMGGVQKTTDFLDKSTWTLGAILVALILLSSISFGGLANDSTNVVDETDVPAKTAPAKGTTTPAQSGTAKPAAPAQPKQ